LFAEIWIRLELRQGQSIKVFTTSPTRFDSVITLFDEDLNEIMVAESTDGVPGPDATLEIEDVLAGAYYLEVKQMSSPGFEFAFVPIASYQLHFELEQSLVNMTPIIMMLLKDEIAD